MKRVYVVALCLFCISAMAVQAQELTVAVDNANPPFMYAEAGKAQGLYPEMIGKIFERMGQGVSVKAYPWKRVLKLGTEGKAGIGGIYKNDERLRIFDYSDPLFSERLVLFINKEKYFEYKGVEDLDGKKIGTLLGWSYGREFDSAQKEKRFTVEAVKSDAVNFKKLAQGWLDAVVAIELAGQKLVAQDGLQEKVVMASIPVAVNDTYLVFAKTENKAQLLAGFNRALADMKTDGSYEGLIRAAVSK